MEPSRRTAGRGGALEESVVVLLSMIMLELDCMTTLEEEGVDELEEKQMSTPTQAPAALQVSLPVQASLSLQEAPTSMG